MAETNQQQSTHWLRSRRFWGLATIAISAFAPKYAPIAEALPALFDEVGTIVGIVLGLYGSAKAKGPMTTPF